MLASVYSYHVMVKSVSSCVRGRRALSNPVTIDIDCSITVFQSFAEFISYYAGIMLNTFSDPLRSILWGFLQTTQQNNYYNFIDYNDYFMLKILVHTKCNNLSYPY